MTAQRARTAAIAVALTVMAGAVLVGDATAAQTSGPGLFMGFWDNDLNATHTFTNFDQGSDNVTELLLNKAMYSGVQQMYASFNAFITRGQHGYELRPDYEARWAAVVPTVEQLLDNGTIFGVFLGDELVWNCLSDESLHLYAQAVRASFPRGYATLWQNEAAFLGNNPVKDSCGVPHPHYKIPSELDWFSVDIYHMNGPDPDFVKTWVIPFYENNIFGNLTTDQKAVLVPGSFGSHVNRDVPNGLYDQASALDAINTYDWASSDPRIAAITPWNWGGCAACNGSKWTPPHTCCMNEIGTRDQPLARAMWTAIGQEILAGSPAGSMDRVWAAAQGLGIVSSDEPTQQVRRYAAPGHKTTLTCPYGTRKVPGFVA